MTESRLNLLLLADDWPGHANTVLDHIGAFTRLSRHRVRVFNPKDMKRSRALDLDEFDAVLIHYSLVIATDRYLAPPFREQLRRYRGLKVQFIQDEYRWVDTITAVMRDLGVGLLYTAVPEPAASTVYDSRLPGVPRRLTLTGYVPDNLVGLSTPRLAERPLDVVYRGRELPFWLGRLAHEKVTIAQRWLEEAARHGLTSDVGWREQDRVYGRSWIDFVTSGRATLGTESGASIFDFDGSAEAAVRRYMREHPDASFEEVDREVLGPYEGNAVVNVVSPRVFEAAALRTALVMHPGDYSGVVRADEHYIPLAKDFSNLREVAERLRDLRGLEAMTERVYEEVVASGHYGYQRFIADFDADIEERVRPRVRGRAPRYRAARVERALRVPPLYLRAYRAAFGAAATITRSELPRRLADDPGSYSRKGVLAIQKLIRQPDLRRVVAAGRRERLPMDRLLEEVLEISLLRQPAGFVVDASLEERNLRLESRPAEDGAGAGRPADLHEVLASGGLESIVWDHRRVGTAVRSGGLEIAIGNEGRERFELLAELSRRAPEAVEALLAPALPGPVVAAPSSKLRPPK